MTWFAAVSLVGTTYASLISELAAASLFAKNSLKAVDRWGLVHYDCADILGPFVKGLSCARDCYYAIARLITPGGNDDN